jgi:hypothetical protein
MEFEFATNEEVDDVGRVPEQFRGLYAEDPATKKFKLSETYKGVATAVDGLNRSLRAARRDADTLKKTRPDVTAFGAIGQLVGLEGDDAVNPETLKAAIERVISESKDGKVNWDKMKKDLERGFQTQLQAKDGEIGTMSKSLQKYLVTTAAVQAIASQKGMPELLLPHIAAKTKVVKEGDDYVVRVVDEAGDPRGNASGGFMTVEDLVKEMKASPTYGRAFDSDGTQGSGTPPRQGSGTPPRQSNAPVTPIDRIKKGLDARSKAR